MKNKEGKTLIIELYGEIGVFDVFNLNEDALKEMLKKSLSMGVKNNRKIILSGLGFKDAQSLYPVFSSLPKTKIKIFEIKKDFTVSEIMTIIKHMHYDLKKLETFFYNSLEDKNCILSGSVDNKIWKIKSAVFHFENGSVMNDEIKISHSAYHSHVFRDILLLSKRNPNEIIRSGSLFACL